MILFRSRKSLQQDEVKQYSGVIRKVVDLKWIQDTETWIWAATSQWLVAWI